MRTHLFVIEPTKYIVSHTRVQGKCHPVNLDDMQAVCCYIVLLFLFSKHGFGYVEPTGRLEYVHKRMYVTYRILKLIGILLLGIFCLTCVKL